MNRLLWKILLSKQGKWQFFIAGTGLCAGLLIMLLSVQLYGDLQQVLKTQQSREDEPAYLLINKEVSLLNTFDKTISGFKTEEIEDFNKQKFILDIGEFQTNRFGISADLTMQIGFSTDLFFESVPNEFIDNVPDEFIWEAEKKFIPVIVSTEFLNLYNFGYAMTQGLPQLPKAAIQMIPFDVTLSGKGKKQKFSARVVAFSERIPSVLVPWEFMNWANAEFADGTKAPSRLIIKVSDPGDEQLKNYLAEKKFITNTERMGVQKAGAVLKMFVTIAATIGLLFVGLSFVIFLINFQLILSRAQQEIDMLLLLGYTRQSISRLLNFQFVMVLILVAIIAWLAHLMAVNKVHGFFAENGFILQSEHLIPFIAGISLLALMLVVNVVVMRFSVR